MTTREVLQRAADLLEQIGWHPGYGALVDAKTKRVTAVCPLTAISMTTENQLERNRAIVHLFRLLGGAPPLRQWNAREGQTRALVVAAIRRAADGACLGCCGSSP